MTTKITTESKFRIGQIGILYKSRTDYVYVNAILLLANTNTNSEYSFLSMTTASAVVSVVADIMYFALRILKNT